MGLTINDGLWLRILDLEAALSARTYVGSGSLVLDVADDMIDSNAGRWQLAVDGGRAVVSRTTHAPDLELDVGTLAAAYLGGFRFVDLAVAGRVRECRVGLASPRGLAVHAAACPLEPNTVLTPIPRDRRSRSI